MSSGSQAMPEGEGASYSLVSTLLRITGRVTTSALQLPEPAVSGGRSVVSFLECSTISRSWFRQWLLRGHMNPGNQEVGVGSAPALDRGRPASQRIQQCRKLCFL